MKKRNVINLIRYHSENNDAAFHEEAYAIAKDFDMSGDSQLAEYIMALLSNANTFIPQMSNSESAFFEKVAAGSDILPLPEIIQEDILGIMNAISYNIGINKILFQGPPGTGKTESAKQVARILDRELFVVSFSSVIDSKLGQTQKNISRLFDEINTFAHPEKVVVLFDEIDALALDRTNSNDLREMGRATSALLREMDRMNSKVLLIATTNLFDHFDKAMVRRFDSVIDFDRYTQDDLMEIAEALLDIFLHKVRGLGKNSRLFRKILYLASPLPYPGELKNLIRTAVAFSSPNDKFDYLRQFYRRIYGDNPSSLSNLQAQGFTVREIEILTGVSKSQVSRELKETIE